MISRVKSTKQTDVNGIKMKKKKHVWQRLRNPVKKWIVGEGNCVILIGRKGESAEKTKAKFRQKQDVVPLAGGDSQA